MPRERRETLDPPSVDIKTDSLLEDSDAPNDDTSKQDFAFEDVFEYDHDEHFSATSSDDNSVRVSVSKHKGRTDFSFSHYSRRTKGAGHGKMTRTKSGYLRPRVVRVKSGCRRAD